MKSKSAEHPLREYRHQRGLTQAQMAALMNTTKVTVSRIETGERAASAAMMKRIADATHGAVTPNDLLSVQPAT
jgi:transcriptional regulator with XRE-family HTH domain